MQTSKRIISVSEAILESTEQYLKKFNDCIVIGEGINDPKGIFGTTLNLSKKFGKARIIESPISENGVTGISIGLSMNDFKVLLVHQRTEFALLSLEQIFNNAAKSYYVSNGSYNVPIVIRMIIGRGWGQGPAHSQSLETVFSYIPGLKVLMPSSAYDAKGMLWSALEDPNPVLIIEHRWLHYVKGVVPKKPYLVNIDSPSILIKGEDITIVANSYNITEVIICSKIMKKFGINIEIIDLRVLRPLNIKPIIKSLKKTKNLLIIETGYKKLGIGSEIISQISETELKNSIKSISRIGLPDHPTPSTRSLAKKYYGSLKEIADRILKQIKVELELKKEITNYLNVNFPQKEIDVPNADFKGPF